MKALLAILFLVSTSAVADITISNPDGSITHIIGNTIHYPNGSIAHIISNPAPRNNGNIENLIANPAVVRVPRPNNR